MHLLTLIAGDVMRERKRWLYFIVLLVLIGLIGLGALGALILGHQAMQQQLCWTRPSNVAETTGLSSRICGWLGKVRERVPAGQ